VHEWPDKKIDPDSKEDVLGKILAACRGLVPDFSTDESIHSFSGARSKTDVGDWIIKASDKDKNFIQVFIIFMFSFIIFTCCLIMLSTQCLRVFC